jgi:peptidoglycan/LPS O-acetylase OafA/YrhL
MVATLLRDRLFLNLSHSYSEVVANALFLFNFIPEWQTGIVWASWTIGVEMVFYFLFPYIWEKCSGVAETVYRVMLFLTLSIAAYTIVFYFDDGAKFWQWSFFKHLPSFLLGILAYAAWKATRARKHDNEALGRMFLGVSIFLGAGLLYSGQEFQLIPALYWQAVIFSLLAIGAALGAARTFFSIPALRWVGKNSYSIYLAHPLIIVALQPVYKVVAAHAGFGSLAFLICACVTLCCVFITSEICWRLVEKPSIDAGSRLIRHLRTINTEPQHSPDNKKI